MNRRKLLGMIPASIFGLSLVAKAEKSPATPIGFEDRLAAVGKSSRVGLYAKLDEDVQTPSEAIFPRTTNKARRAIFFARYEARCFGGNYIEPEHLLLGILREDRQLFPASTRDNIEGKIRDYVRRKLSGGPDVTEDPMLSRFSRNVIRLATEIADQWKHEYIGTEHLMLALWANQNRYIEDVFAHYQVSSQDILATAQARNESVNSAVPPNPQAEA